MADGRPCGTADNDERDGGQGALLIEGGISSSYHIASFFGLTDWIRQAEAAAKEQTAANEKAVVKEAATRTSKQAAKLIPAIPPTPAPDLTNVLWPRVTLNRHPEPPRRRAIDVGGVITRALTAAGLMKSEHRRAPVGTL